MADFEWRGPVVVLDPTADPNPATKEYVDDEIAGVGGGGDHAAEHATGGGDILTPAAIGAEAVANKNVASGYAGTDSTNRVDKARMPPVPNSIRTGNVTTSVTSDASTTSGNLVNLNANGNITINQPISAVDWQYFEWHVLANGADRTVTFSGFATSGPSLGPYTVTNGKLLIAKAEYVNTRTPAAWTLTFVGITDELTPPNLHASRHATAGADPIAPADIGAVPTSRTVSAGTGLTGGGDLSANRSLAVSYGTSASTAAEGNDSRITGAVQGSRLVSAGTGLSGGGDLSADRTITLDTTAEAERIRDEMATALVAGSNVTITPDDNANTITIASTGGGGSTGGKFQWRAIDGLVRTTALPALLQVNGTNIPIAGYAFDAAAEEAIFFQFRATGYTSGNVSVELDWYADTASSGVVRWGAQIAAITPDADSQDIETDALATQATFDDTHLGTTGQRVHRCAVTVSSLDSLAADDLVMLRVSRVANHANDTMTGDAILVNVAVSYS